MGELSVTWEEDSLVPFQPLFAGLSLVYGAYVAGLVASVDAERAEMIVDPVQGEGGVRPVSPEMARCQDVPLIHPCSVDRSR